MYFIKTKNKFTTDKLKVSNTNKKHNEKYFTLSSFHVMNHYGFFYIFYLVCLNDKALQETVTIFLKIVLQPR